MAVSIWLAATVVINSYRAPASPNFGSYFLVTVVIIVIALPPHQNFGSYFLVFGKYGVTPHHLFCDLLILNFLLYLIFLLCVFLRLTSSFRQCFSIKN